MSRKTDEPGGSVVNYLLLVILILSLLAVVAIPKFFPAAGQMTAMASIPNTQR